MTDVHHPYTTWHVSARHIGAWLVSAGIALSISVPSVYAESSSSARSVETALQKAQILPETYAFRVTHKGADAIVQTYERPSSIESDVKIDAVLIARLVTEKIPDVARVKILFFRPDRTNYQQVLVTVGDITAFGGGAISKEKLLQSLEVQRVATGEPSATDRRNSTDGSKPGFFRSGKLSFSYPPGWTFVPAPTGGESLGELIVPGGQGWASVGLIKQATPSPEAQAVFDSDYSLKHAHRLVRKGPVSVGVRRMPGYQLLTSGFETEHKEIPRLQQHVYFGSPGEVYGFTLQYSPIDGAKLTPEFVKLLSTVILTGK